MKATRKVCFLYSLIKSEEEVLLKRERKSKSRNVYLLKLPSVTTTTAIFVLSNDAHEIPGDVSDVVHVRGFHFRDNFFHRRGVANLRQGGEHALVDGVSLETAFLNTSDYSVRVRWERTSERLIVHALAAVAAASVAPPVAASGAFGAEVADFDRLAPQLSALSQLRVS